MLLAYAHFRRYFNMYQTNILMVILDIDIERFCQPGAMYGDTYGTVV